MPSVPKVCVFCRWRRGTSSPSVLFDNKMAEVSISHSKCHGALDWAKENCPSYVTNRVDIIRLAEMDEKVGPIYITFFFADEKDATLFALRWK